MFFPLASVSNKNISQFRNVCCLSVCISSIGFARFSTIFPEDKRRFLTVSHFLCCNSNRLQLKSRLSYTDFTLLISLLIGHCFFSLKEITALTKNAIFSLKISNKYVFFLLCVYNKKNFPPVLYLTLLPVYAIHLITTRPHGCRWPSTGVTVPPP